MTEEFENLNINDKKDALDLLANFSRKCLNLGEMESGRTDDEIYDNASDNVFNYFEKFLKEQIEKGMNK